MKRLLLGIVLCLTLSNCAAPKVLQATGGSRADGTVELSYEYGGFERPEPNWGLAQQTATDRCKVWGYKSAEKFGGEKTICQSPSQYGCMRGLITVQYQCVVDGNTGNIK
jgi:YecR-like lipoprotein